jgi:zinc transport system substrate-binding protein
MRVLVIVRVPMVVRVIVFVVAAVMRYDLSVRSVFVIVHVAIDSQGVGSLRTEQLLVFAAVGDILRRTGATDVLVQAYDRIGLRHHDMQVVRNQQYATTECAAYFADEPVQLYFAGKIDALNRLVQHQQVRLAHDGAGKQRALEFAARQGLYRGIRKVFDPDQRESRSNVSIIMMGGQRHHARNTKRQRPVHGHALRDIAGAQPCRAFDIPFVDPEQAEQCFGRCRFSSAVWSDQRDDLTAVNGDIDIADEPAVIAENTDLAARRQAFSRGAGVDGCMVHACEFRNVIILHTSCAAPRQPPKETQQMPRIIHIRVILLSLVLFAALPAAHAQVRVVASIKPVHSLVSAVMQGAGKPEIILQGGGSPHTYTLRPSDARALQNAQVVVWIGENLERFLQAPVKTLAGKARIVELADVPGVTTHAFREGGVWERHGHGTKAHNHNHKHDHDHARVDNHMWVDPENAKAFVRAIAAALAAADPANAALYSKNASATQARLDGLLLDMMKELEPVKKRGFIVFHDSFQYLEKRFGLNGVGSISLGDARSPGARRLREIRRKLKASGAVCIFSEPQFEPRLVRTLLEGSSARTGVLDPLGAAIQNGPDLYFTMMRNNARALRACLSG